MNFQKPKRHVIDWVFMLGLFALFAMLCVILLMMGANVYQKITRRMDNDSMARISLSYISEKIHQADQEGSVRMTKVEDTPALALTAEKKNTSYTTYIYYYEGNVCELLIKSGKTPVCSQGTPVAEVQNLTLEEAEEGCFHVSVTDSSGQVTESYIRAVSDR